MIPLYENLYNVFSSMVGCEVIRGDQNTPAPEDVSTTANSYFVYKVNAITPVGFEIYEAPDAIGDVRYIGTRIIDVFTETIGVDSMDIMNRLRRDMNKHSSKKVIYDNSLIYMMDLNNITNTTRIQGAGFVKSYSWDMRFRTVEEYFDNVDLIEKVDIDTDVNNKTETITIKEE